MKKFNAVVASFALLGAVSAVNAAVIQDLNVVFDLPVPSAGPGGVPPLSDLSVTGPGGGDHLTSTWWYYRLAGQTQEFPLVAPTADSVTGGGRIRVLEYTIPGVKFELRFEVTSTGPNSGTLVQRLTVSNLSPAPVSLSVFNYLDTQLGATPANDTADSLDTDLIATSDAAWSATFEGPGANGFQGGVFNGSFFGLTDAAPTTLSSSGLPAAGDLNFAFQRNIPSISPGLSRSYVTTLSIVPIPEPTTAALLGLPGLSLLARRRRA